MTLQDLRQNIAQDFALHCQELLGRHPAKEAFLYTLLPPGKLLRPLMVATLAQDLNENADLRRDSSLALLMSFVEIHHTYTLIHDDLPCMDNDDFRRGRPSLHRAYNEWQALLVGDGLINLSYQLLGRLKTSETQALLKLSSKLLGPHGLILGQILDLSTEDGPSAPSLCQILNIHTLKTARLFQVCLVGSALLALEERELKNSRSLLYDLYKLGAHLGVIFQLLDDWDELKSEVSAHEKKINAFFLYPEAAAKALEHNFKRAFSLMKKHQLSLLQSLVETWPAPPKTRTSDETLESAHTEKSSY